MGATRDSVPDAAPAARQAPYRAGRSSMGLSSYAVFVLASVIRAAAKH
jgi:hypothetical protein